MATYKLDLITEVTIKNPDVEVLRVDPPVNGRSAVFCRMALGNINNPNAVVDFFLYGMVNDGTLTKDSQETTDWVNNKLIQLEG